MRIFLILIISIFTYACSKSKTVLICGDHICINKTEAKQFFEKNLTLEVKILDRKKIKTFDLVQLNLKKDKENNRKVIIEKKNNTSKKVKKLSKNEIKKIKQNIKEKEKTKKKKLPKNMTKKMNSDVKKIKKEKEQEFIESKVTNKKIIDVCKIIDNCNIEEISKYLINEGKNKKFPNIRSRQNL